MRIKKVELKNFKRFTHLTVEDISQTAKLLMLVGPNGSGKTSFMEALNHYYSADSGRHRRRSVGYGVCASEAASEN
ncbi:MAG: AAA family ATPase [Clostridiales bacterium]|nr:AAA family ATPase [Clostridiales bacterium]